MSVETDAMDGAIPDLEEGRTPEPGEQPAEGTPEEEEEIPATVVEGEPVAIEPGIPLGDPDDPMGVKSPVAAHCDHEQPEIVARTKGLSRHGGTRLVRWCPSCGSIRVGDQSQWRTPGSWGT